MEPEFLERPRRLIAGIELPPGAPPPYILQLWIRLGTVMKNISNLIDPDVMYGVWRKLDRGGEIDFIYLVGTQVHSTDQGEGIEVWELPAAPCAVFRPTGDMGKITRSFGDIRSWFEGESNPHRPVRDGFTTEVYDTRQPLDERYLVEIWEELAK
jgi:predicted transcriptional regulator YdeE